MPVIEQKTTNKNKVDFDLNRLDKSKTTIFSKYPQLLLSCRHGWVPAPVDFHHYILLSPSLLDAEDGNFRNGGPCWTRTSDTLINSQVLYQLS